METNNEYKGLLGCFPDTIGVHKVPWNPASLKAQELLKNDSGVETTGSVDQMGLCLKDGVCSVWIPAGRHREGQRSRQTGGHQ